MWNFLGCTHKRVAVPFDSFENIDQLPRRQKDRYPRTLKIIGILVFFCAAVFVHLNACDYNKLELLQQTTLIFELKNETRINNPELKQASKQKKGFADFVGKLSLLKIVFF